MFDQLPNPGGFEPRFYRGGAIVRHLPFLYDQVALAKPKLIVTLGFGGGEAHFTFCQAVQETALECRCIAVRRGEEEDALWAEGKAYGEKFYREIAQCSTESPLELGPTFPDGGVDLLLIDDCDSGNVLRRELSAWESKLAPTALVFFHGTQLERADSPRAAWEEWTKGKSAIEFIHGIGLGASAQTGSVPNKDSRQLYRLAGEKVVAEARAAQSARATAAVRLQKVWLGFLLSKGVAAQRKFELLHRDREEAQRVMDHQFRSLASAQLAADAQREQLHGWVATAEKLRAENDELKAKAREQKRILNLVKQTCRKGGNCVREANSARQKSPRSAAERILRELQRWPRSLRSFCLPNKSSVSPKKQIAPSLPTAETAQDPDES